MIVSGTKHRVHHTVFIRRPLRLFHTKGSAWRAAAHLDQRLGRHGPQNQGVIISAAAIQAPALAVALEDATLTPALLSPLGPAELDIERTAIPVRATRTWLQVPRAPTFRPTYRERWHQQHQQVTCPFSPPRCLPCPSDRALHAPFRIAGSPGAAHGQLQRCRAGGRPHALFGNPLTPLP
jgi:hypothetical protein